MKDVQSSIASPSQCPEGLMTIRDWLRYATSRFRAAGLVFGHGTASAIDEAAFLILKALNLPIDQLEPWLACRLTPQECQTVWQLIEARIETRKPAPYLVREAFIKGHGFYVDERVIVPRSYVGELLCGDLTTLVPNPQGVRSILDMCTGSGCLAILAALAFPDATLDAADVSADALDVARINVEAYGLNDRVTCVRTDLFAALQGRRYDLIISNPPYVGTEDMRNFPPEYRAEPAIAHDGGADGLDLVRRIITEAPRHLETDGVLLVEIGSGLDVLENEFSHLPFLWLDTETSVGEVFALTAAELGVGGDQRLKGGRR